MLRFLTLLASHPWSLRPLVVDPAGEIALSDRQTALQVRAALYDMWCLTTGCLSSFMAFCNPDPDGCTKSSCTGDS